MNSEEALQVADKVSDRDLSWAEHPSMLNMIYALGILASDFRTMREKAQAWEQSYRDQAYAHRDQAYAHDQRARKLRDARDTVQRLNELVEFMRTALNLDAHALDDPNQARKILGRAFADARLWARVKDMAGGKFVAGDVVTADVMNAVSEAVKSSRETDMGTMESLTVRLEANESVRINPIGGVYVAPVGTDPKDTSKWTLLGTTPRGGVFVESRKQSTAAPTKLAKLMGSCAPWTDQPAVQLFPVDSPEPDGRVKRVRWNREESEVFIRVGRLARGGSLWQRDSLPGMFFTWTELVKWREMVEVPE